MPVRRGCCPLPRAFHVRDSVALPLRPGTNVAFVAILEQGSTFRGWESKGARCILDDGPLYLSYRVTFSACCCFCPNWGKRPSKSTLSGLTIQNRNLQRFEFCCQNAYRRFASLKFSTSDQSGSKLRKPKAAVPTRNLTSVEVANKNEVKEAPKDAQFLSDKNRDVARADPSAGAKSS